MDFTALVDVGIGLTVVYLGASLFVTVINEYIAQQFKLRGRQLAADLDRLIDSKKIRDELGKMPAFSALFDGKKDTATSYVDSALLAQQLAALVVGKLPPREGDRAPVDRPNEAAIDLSDALERQLRAMWELSGRHGEVFVLHLGTWIEKSLTAMGEVYKQRMQLISFVVGLTLAVMLNLDTVRIVEHLWEDKQSRTALAAVGIESVEAMTQEQIQRCTAARAATAPVGAKGSEDAAACAAADRLIDLVAKRSEAGVRLPIGWTHTPTWGEVWRSQSMVKLLGWVLTALAVSLGASFWFDALKRLVNVRSGMKKPEG